MYSIVEITHPVPRQGRFTYLTWLVGKALARRSKILSRIVLTTVMTGLTVLYFAL